MNYELMTQKELLELILDAEKKCANLDNLRIDIGDTIKVCLANSVIPQVLGRA